jgi:hypothetical protein
MGNGQLPLCGLMQPGVGSPNGNFGRWLKRGSGCGASLCEEKLEVGLPCWGHWWIGTKGSGDRNLPLKGAG